MKTTWIWLALSLGLVACGGGTPTRAHGPDEVTASWTEGDDAPLEGAAATEK